jgi:hypothetical protein
MSTFHACAFRASRLGLMALVFLAFSSSARGQSGGVRPFGSVYGGLGYGAQWGYNWYGYDYDSPRSAANRFSDTFIQPPRAVAVGSTPYLTGQHYEPGDGYRYPLYYNPGTRTYFYYPVQR